MEGHLTALSSTLGSIATLQRQLLHEPKSHPFTNAMLAPLDPNPYAKPPRTFIRESDSVERRLFHFPPVGGMLDDPSANGQQHHYGRGERDVEEEAADIASELIPRKPEVKSVPMPTPLRPTAAAARRTGSGEAARKEYDTRALLIAAQRLSENYNRQPRQRKHIRALLKKTAELREHTTTHARQAMRFEAVLARITNGEDPHTIEELPALLSGVGPDGASANDIEEQKKKQKRIQELKDKAQKVKEELNREEMEVLALEEMRDEMLQKSLALKEKLAPSSSSSAAARKPTVAEIKAKATSRAIPRVVAAAQGTKARPAPRTSAGAAGGTSTTATRKPSASPTRVTKPAATATTSTARPGGSRPRLSAGTSASAKGAGSAATRKSSSPATPKSAAGPTGPRKSTDRSSTASSRKSAGADAADADGEDDITVRLKPEEIAAAAAAASAGAAESPLLSASADLRPDVDIDIDLDDNDDADPVPTDELERLAEKTWEIFGDHLRVFTKDPTLESADYKTTLSLLRRFLPHNSEADRPGSSEAAAVAAAKGKDPEVASASGVSSDAPNVGTGTGASASSVTGGVGGSGASQISAPTRASRILALTLLELLRAPDSDHSVDLAHLKTLVKEWFSGAVAAGRETPLEGAESGEGTDTLATQTVYGMVAKRGFKVRRTGGKALVRFT